MNYPKKGIFIKPESTEDSEIIQAVLYRKGIFFTVENDGVFVGENAHDVRMQFKDINDAVFTAGVIANVHICKPERKTELNAFND